MKTRVKQGIMGHWYLSHPDNDFLAWSGRQWTECSDIGWPTGEFQVCNFLSEDDAVVYALEHGFTVIVRAAA